MTALGFAAAGVVLLLGWARRPAPSRVRDLVAGGGPAAARPSRTHVALLLAAAALVAAPPALALIALWWWGAPKLAARRVTRMRNDEIARALPDVCDLLLLATGAGLTLSLALPLVTECCDGVVGHALAQVNATASRGTRLADALASLTSALGDGARPLAGALVDHERYGTPLLPALERVGQDLRLDRRRRAEQSARRVPVQLLFPLVLCTLPAFALLTVVPLLAGSLGGLRL